MSEFRYVRLKKYRPRAGQKAKSRWIMHGGGVFSFKVLENGQRPWVKVPLAVAEMCEEMTVDPNRPGTPLCFEVCTESEAREMDAAAERERLAMRAREAPTVDDAIDQTRTVPSSGSVNDLTLSDVHRSRSEAMASATTPAADPAELAKIQKQLAAVMKANEDGAAKNEELARKLEASEAARVAAEKTTAEKFAEKSDEKPAPPKVSTAPPKKGKKPTGKKRGRPPKKR